MNNLIEEAKHQRDCHREQVSGVWSINAEEFCRRTGIANLYNDAIDYQNEREYEDQEQYEADSIQRYESEIGDLTESQFDRIHTAALVATSSDDGYSAYFWDFVVKRLEAANE